MGFNVNWFYKCLTPRKTTQVLGQDDIEGFENKLTYMHIDFSQHLTAPELKNMQIRKFSKYVM